MCRSVWYYVLTLIAFFCDVFFCYFALLDFSSRLSYYITSSYFEFKFNRVDMSSNKWKHPICYVSYFLKIRLCVNIYFKIWLSFIAKTCKKREKLLPFVINVVLFIVLIKLLFPNNSSSLLIRVQGTHFILSSNDPSFSARPESWESNSSNSFSSKASDISSSTLGKQSSPVQDKIMRKLKLSP